MIYRPLLFSSLDEQVAQAKGVPVGFMNICFMTIMAGVITIAVPAVGTLLIFALAITPAATANIIARSPFKAMVVATVICLISIWGGLVISAMRRLLNPSKESSRKKYRKAVSGRNQTA